MFEPELKLSSVLGALSSVTPTMLTTEFFFMVFLSTISDLGLIGFIFTMSLSARIIIDKLISSKKKNKLIFII
jgi:hypothetical protein